MSSEMENRGSTALAPADESTPLQRAIASQQQVYERRTRRNSTQPINARLPTVVLSEIFTRVVDEEGQKAVGRLAGVCHLWKEIVYHTPDIYDTLNISISKPEWVAVVLARSKAVPLYITCPSPLIDRAIPGLLSPHFGRIIDLQLAADPSILLELFATCDALPMGLRSLRLKGTLGHTTVQSMSRVLPIQMPSLQILELVGIALPHNLAPLPQLRRLYLSLSDHYDSGSIIRLLNSEPVEPELPMSTLLSFLDGTPSLEELAVHGILSASRIPIRDLELQTVKLPSLSWVSFESQHVENVAFFKLIQYPSSARLRLKCTDDPLQMASAMDELETIISHSSSSEAGAKVDSVFIDNDQSKLRLQAHIARTPLLDVQLAVVRGDPRPFGFLSMLPSSNVETLHVGMHDFLSSFRNADWANFFGRYEHVRELSVDHVVSPFIRGLMPSGGVSPQALPKLNTIKLRRCVLDTEQVNMSWWSVADPIEQFLRERIRFNMPLEMLEIIDPLVQMNATTIARLQQIIQIV
ncbi:hypothetical protein AB1N83_011312 [Pleurotus pulmonarius]